MEPFSRRTVSRKKVKAYETVINVFEMVFREVKEQAKKKPETTLSITKVRIINKVLEDVRTVVEKEPEIKYLEPLDEEMLPQMGDAVIMMAQYEAALTSFRARHYGRDDDDVFNEARWFIKDD
jgi:hypothetical protein